MQVKTDDIKLLRERTGAGVMDCRKALVDAQGDIDKAVKILQECGWAAAEKKASREASMGLIESYVHAGGKLGVIVEVNCETDFVARTSEFQALAHDIALQLAAMNPKYIKAGEVPEAEKDKSPEICLMLQPFIKDPTRTIESLVKDTIAKVGENIQVKRFCRFELGK
ncbi:MAG: translation elongation factor Ts [Candidatus Tectomicrobia bacterium]|uniref:Elongation factor Ts n=1 Tax=Tectimicrobiota bacterium TaxID=2528274 RepID=A0A933GN10_UNCTE|nr:translation elongation factor Ts [Candidatus Tectomicrobia bacterium]